MCELMNEIINESYSQNKHTKFIVFQDPDGNLVTVSVDVFICQTGLFDESFSML